MLTDDKDVEIGDVKPKYLQKTNEDWLSMLSWKCRIVVMAEAGRTAMRLRMCEKWHEAPQKRRPAGEATHAVSLGCSISFNVV